MQHAQRKFLNRLGAGGIAALLLVIWLGVLVGPAQGGGDLFSLTPTPAPAGNILFEDDFSTYSRRWLELESPKAIIQYQEGALVARVESPGVAAWSVPDFVAPPDAYRFEMTAEFRGGSPDAQVGSIVTYGVEEGEQWVAVLVTQAGEWQVLAYNNPAPDRVFYAASGWTDLTPPDAVPVSRDPEQTTLEVRVEVPGDGMLVLWIDQQRAGEVTLPEDLTGTGFGLIARAGHGYVEAAFTLVQVSLLAGDNTP